jgi:2'-5' RNA ligase
MKYLVQFAPSLNLVDAIDAYRKTMGDPVGELPKSGLHCTVMFLHADQTKESTLVERLQNLDLKQIAVPASGIVTTDMSVYDENALVLRLERTEELHDMHKRIADACRTLIDRSASPPLPAQFAADKLRRRAYDRYGSPYFGQFYSPHITIGTAQTDLAPDPRALSGQLCEIDHLLVSRKGKQWESIDLIPLT